MGKLNYQADTKNANKGSTGANQTYDKNQGNRGKQMNPTPNNTNQQGGKKKK